MSVGCACGVGSVASEWDFFFLPLEETRSRQRHTCGLMKIEIQIKIEELGIAD